MTRASWAVGLAVAGALAVCACRQRTAVSTPPPASPIAPARAVDEDRASPASHPSGDAREPRATNLIQPMLRRVEVARGLQAKGNVPGVVLRRDELIARVKKHLTQELPAEAIRNEGLVVKLYGFIPTKYDYEAAEYGLLEAQLAGYYEPADATMYMANDLPDVEADATLAHELVHAIQDQYWDLKDRSRYRPGEGDRSEATSALAEGDATSAMFDVMLQMAAPGRGRKATDMPDDVFVEQIRSGMNEGAVGDAPHFMRASLVAPYVHGTLFVHALRRRGGWAAVDRAWEDPPRTTEQILHVDKWLAREPALAVQRPVFATLGAGWSVADEDTEGELGARLAFEEWTAPDAAAAAASGWGGDREVLLSNGDRSAYAWRLRFDPGKGGERAARAFAAIAGGLANSGREGDRTFSCRERSDRGPAAVARFGDDVILVLGPAHTAGPTWSSAADCSLSRAWTREIAQSR